MRTLAARSQETQSHNGSKDARAPLLSMYALGCSLEGNNIGPNGAAGLGTAFQTNKSLKSVKCASLKAHQRERRGQIAARNRQLCSPDLQ